MRRTLSLALPLLISGTLAGGELRGRFTLEDRPVAGIQVVALPYEEPQTAARREARGGVAPQPIASAVSRSDGAFTLALPEGASAVVEVLVGAANTTSLGLFDGGEDEDLGDVVLTPQEKSEAAGTGKALLRGVVVEARSGKPVAKARVRISRGRAVRYAVTGPDGGYRVRALPAGVHEVRVDEPRHARFAMAVTLAEGEARRLEVRLALGARLSGRVVDEEGKPVAEARCRLTLAAASPAPIGVAREASILSAADGTFRARRLPPGELELAVSHPEKLPARLGGLTLAPGGARTGLTVVLRAGQPLVLRVVDPEGQPIADAALEAQPTLRIRRRRDVLTLGKTGLDGRLVVKTLPPGDYEINAEKKGYAAESPATVSLREGVPPPPMVVTMAKSADIRGFVRRRDGTPVEGVGVSVTSRTVGSGSTSVGPASAEDGSFVIEGLIPGESYALSVFKPGRDDAPAATKVVAPAQDVLLPFPGKARVTGRALDADSERPIADFVAAVAPADSYLAGRLRTLLDRHDPLVGVVEVHAEDGSFTVEATAGDVEALVDAKGYESGRTALRVEEGESKNGVEVRLRRASSLSGRVVDDRGKPVAGAEVMVESSPFAGSPYFREPQAVSDADGRFRVEDVEGDRQRVVARHPDYALGIELVEVAPGKPAHVEVRLSRGASLSGVVVDEARRPVPGADVRLLAAGENAWSAGEDSWRIAGESGRFRFDRLPPGRYSVAAEASRQKSVPVELALRAAEARQDVVLTLTAGLTVRGSILGLSADELPRVRVQVVQQGGVGSVTRPGADGRFEAGGFSSGEALAVAEVGNGASERSVSKQLVLSGSDAEVELVFQPGYTLSGRVLQRGGPVPDIWVVANAVKGGDGVPGAAATTDGAGTYALHGLRAGEYRVTTYSSHTSAVRRTLTISGDQTLDIDLPSARLHGVVTEAGSRRPVDGVRVMAKNGEAPAGYGLTDGLGRFEVTDLEVAPLTLTFERDGYRTETRTSTPAESGGEDIAVELTRGEGLQVQARDGIFGVPLRELEVRVSEGSVLLYGGDVALDAEGRGEIPSLKLGRMLLRAGARGYAPAELEVTVPSPMLALALTPGGTLEVRVGERTRTGRATHALLLTPAGRPAFVHMHFSEMRVPLNRPVQRLEHLPPGTYVLAVEGAPPQTFTVSEGGTAVVELP